ncbi:MAG: carbohydrate-binding family 9-like protein [Gemmatimonadota bacterium]
MLSTRAKILWSEDALWIGAELEEPHVWGTLTERDAVIYLDDDFEVFLDPDGDSHGYYELEINALGTEWDLLLVRPYRDGGPAIHAWDIPGLRTAVSVAGTLNRPDDQDVGWSVEIAIPWDGLGEATDVPVPPRPGDRWRLNFSRVDWPVEIRDGETVKRVDPSTGETLPERNWVWSPQGLVAMHYPEMWGFLVFADEDTEPGDYDLAPRPEERAGWFLRQVYYAQQEYRARTGEWARRPVDLEMETGADFRLAGMATTPHGFEAWVDLDAGPTIRIDHEGRVRVSR